MTDLRTQLLRADDDEEAERSTNQGVKNEELRHPPHLALDLLRGLIVVLVVRAL